MIKAILEIIAKVLTVFLGISKGDQPSHSEIEQATNGLEKENKDLQNKLEKEIKKKESK